MDTKKKVIYAVIAIIAAFFGWQMMGMMGGSEEEAGPKMQPNPDIPKVSTLMPQQQKPSVQMTEREMQLMKLQQDTQTKYLAALNELQMLKIEKDIAETSRDVSKAKLEGITAQKSIVELLTPAKPDIAPGAYAQGLDKSPASGVGGETTTTTTTTTADSAVQSTSNSPVSVISVSRIRGQWTAVIGYNGSLYNVKDGDVLPGEGSVVVGIQRDGIVLEKNGARKVVSMVPII